MTALLERFCVACRIHRSRALPRAERKDSPNTIGNCDESNELNETKRSSQTKKRLAKLTYLAIQITLFVLQTGPASCHKQTELHADLTKPALASIASISTIGDYDGDRRLDYAEFHQAGAHRCIRIRFGNQGETHLLFIDTFFGPGTLLSRDVNNDHKPDLLWIFHYKLMPAVIWLGDGLGHFASATSKEDLHSLIFGYPGAKIVDASSTDAPLYLTNSPIFSDLLDAVTLKADIQKPFVRSASNRRRDLGLYLSYLRERGPPTLVS
jgi:hypothetical protein